LLYGLAGGLAIDPVNTGTLWYSDGTGVQKSTDGGDNWRATKGLINGGGPSIVVDPHNPSILYVAPFNGRTTPQVPSIYKSNDGGETWVPLTSSPFVSPPGPLPRLAIDSQSSLYALIGGALFKSSDGGVTFTQLKNAPPSTLVTVDPTTPSIVYVGVTGGLFRSADGGATFSKIYDTQVQALAIDPASPTTLYLSSVNPGILKSTDRGATWKPTGLSIPYVNTIAVDPARSGEGLRRNGPRSRGRVCDQGR
jgi:photosystem II stability/assembly factor-like uncharacterized protein